MRENRRGLLDRITNRDLIEKHEDVIREQKHYIDLLNKNVREKDELILVQADALDELEGRLNKLINDIGMTWERMPSKETEKDESKKDKSG